MAQSVRKPCLAAAAFFAALALVIARLAVAPLGAADLLGIAACAAAAGAFATLAFAVRPAAPAPVSAALAKEIAAQVEARLFAGRFGPVATNTAAAPAPAAGTDDRPSLQTDQIAASPAAKPRLGRGLAGLMNHPSALAARPAAPAPETASDGDRAAA